MQNEEKNEQKIQVQQQSKSGVESSFDPAELKQLLKQQKNELKQKLREQKMEIKKSISDVVVNQTEAVNEKNQFEILSDVEEKLTIKFRNELDELTENLKKELADMKLSLSNDLKK